MSLASITAFAKKLNISSGIVVGRLQHMRKIKYSAFNELKIRYDWPEWEFVFIYNLFAGLHSFSSSSSKLATLLALPERMAAIFGKLFISWMAVRGSCSWDKRINEFKASILSSFSWRVEDVKQDAFSSVNCVTSKLIRARIMGWCLLN